MCSEMLWCLIRKYLVIISNGCDRLGRVMGQGGSSVLRLLRVWRVLQGLLGAEPILLGGAFRTTAGEPIFIGEALHVFMTGGAVGRRGFGIRDNIRRRGDFLWQVASPCRHLVLSVSNIEWIRFIGK